MQKDLLDQGLPHPVRLEKTQYLPKMGYVCAVWFQEGVAGAGGVGQN